MEGILVLGFIIAALALLDVLAMRFGADSRQAPSDVPASAGIAV